MKQIRSVLIANRGEIASRVIRTCKKMGIKSIAVFSDADRNAPFVVQADTAIHIGESAPSASYLVHDKIIDAAKKTRADAIHPGYGFLSENTAFAKRCAQEGIIFIAPNSNAIDAMGSKSKAKELMQKHKVPTVPGYQGSDQSKDRISKAAIEIGFPVLLKAAAGGGGKGMRIVHKASELDQAIDQAKRESKGSFGDDELIIEKYIASGRHIEFQIFGDKHGNAIHILERECTIQRRYQKVLEESPSPVMNEVLRKKMGAAAVNAAKALNYDNAGTVEFIYDDKSGEFYFLEVNTRLQVEHPVTEEVTGLDLVQMQIESAQGIPLSIKQEDIICNGYALEARLYAEDPANNFLPVTGIIERFELPAIEGLRIETAIESGSQVSIYYDPMIAKIIVWDKDRTSVHRKMAYALRNMVCTGITTNQDFLLTLVENEEFKAGKYDTHFIQDKINLNALNKKDRSQQIFAAIASVLYDWNNRNNKRGLLRSIPSGWRNSFFDYQKEKYSIGDDQVLIKYRYSDNVFEIIADNHTYHVSIVNQKQNQIRIEIDGVQHQFNITQKNQFYYLQNEQIGNLILIQQDRLPVKEVEKVNGGYIAPMPSQIVKILVNEGQQVKSGDSLIIISSMKMENTLIAESEGMVEEIFTTEGANVEAGFLLLKLKN